MRYLSLFLAFAFCSIVSIKHRVLQLGSDAQFLFTIGAILAFVVLIEAAVHDYNKE